MPKLGRRVEVAELEYQWKENMTTSFAPFGTHDTPQMRTKIVGGQPFMVAEDRKRTTIPAEDPHHSQVSPGRGGNGGTSPRLAPMGEKHYFDHTPKNIRNTQMGFMNQRHDVSSHPNSASSLNPHPVVPPIGPHVSESSIISRTSPLNTQAAHVPPAQFDITELLKYMPKDSLLPTKPVTYTKKEELELRRRVHLDLKGLDPKRFKDVYVELAAFDRQLTGLINIQELGYTLSRFQVNINALHMRLLAAMYVSPTEASKINYEKLLAFLASSQRDPSTMPAGGPATDPNAHLAEEQLKSQGIFYNAITHQHEDFSPRSSKFPYNDRENAKLLRYLETQLTESPEPLDMEKCWSAFSMADRGKRGTLSGEKIRQLCHTCGIPIQGSLINAILLRCDENNGQYKWEQFLEFLGRVAPKQTGLRIPESKKPAEYARRYPSPDANWPNGEWDNNDYGIPRNQIRKPANFRQPESNTSQNINPDSHPFEPTSATRQLPSSGVTYTTDGSSWRSNSLSDQDREVLPVDPNEYLSTWNPRVDNLEDLESRVQKQTEADRRQREMDQLEQNYDRVNHKPETSSKQPKDQYQGSEPWFDRFMKMANAVYSRDSESTGKVSMEDMLWIVEEYNRSYGLGFSESTFTKILQNHSRDKMVFVDPVLRELGVLGK